MAVTPDTLRATLAALPGVSEQDHHGFPSFRVRGKVIATLPTPGLLRVMLDEAGIRTTVAAHPECCAESWWGRTLSCVAVTLADAPVELVADLVRDAWERRAG